MKLHHKVILITGGTSGIGYALAAQLLARGNTVIVTELDPVSLERTRIALPGVHVFQSDVSDAAAIVQLFDMVTSQFPTLDVIVIMRSLDMNSPRD